MSTTFRILVLDTAAQTHNSYIPLAIVDALQRHPAVELVRQADYGTAIEVFRSQRCDTFLAVGGAGGDFAVIARLCALATRAALWTTEDPYELEENLRIAAPFDAVFTNDLASLPVYGEAARHLPLAASPLFHDLAPGPDEEALYDLCFVGTAWPNRVRTINRILTGVRRPLRMKIALPANPHLPPVELVDRALFTNWRVPNPELARIANRSRITLNLERQFSAARPDQASGSTPPPRLFENALAGAFQISLGGGAEARRYFDPETEIAFCDGEDALIERIEWALDHPEARTAMAAAARRRARAEHLYDHRVDAILAALATCARPAPPVTAEAARKRVLLVTHNVAGHQPGGGVETYQHELAEGLAEFEVYTVFPQTSGGATFYTLIAHRTGERHRYGVPHGVGTDALHDAAHEQVFERILVENDIDLVHFQHLIGMPLSLPVIARACGVPTLYTLHDFYLVCTSFNLIDYRGQFCDIANRSPSECGICLGASGISGDAQQRRRNFIARMLDAVDVVVANTPFTADYVRAIYPGLAPERVRVVEMLTPAPHRPAVAARPGGADGQPAPLRVAIPGNFTRPKGADAVLRVMSALRDEPVEFVILGTIQDVELERHVRGLALPRVTLHGGYAAHELPSLLRGVDLSLHLSVWPETYMISLSEAWASGVVPIVTDLGAPGERVRDGVDGFKVGVNDAGRVCDVIRAMAFDRDRLAVLRRNAAARPAVSPAEHVAEIGALYHDLMRSHPIRPSAATVRPERDCILSSRACGIRTNNPSWKQEGSGWDAPAPARPARETREADVWRTFPTRFAHIARETVPPERQSLVRLAVDRLEADHRTASGSAIAVARGLRVEGWAFVAGHGRSLDVILHVKGEDREIYAVNPPVRRADVARHLGEAAAETSGFSFDLDLAQLRDGPHDVRLLQVYDGIVMDLGSLCTILVDRGGTAAPGPEQAGRADFAPGPAAVPRPASADAALVRLQPDPAGAPALLVEGWAADRARRRVLPQVHVGFVRQDGAAAWFKAARGRAPAALSGEDPLFSFCGFRLAVPQGLLEPGLHRIAVAESDRGETIVHETDDAVMAFPDRVVPASREAVAGPGTDAVPRVSAPPPEHRIAIDQAETDGGRQRHSLSIDGDRYLYLRGWAFVPGLGRASGLFLNLVGPERSLRVALAPMPRGDVAAHLKSSEARDAGFEVLLPLRDLPPGRYEAEVHYAAEAATAVLPVDLLVDKSAALAA
ncbi:hypothetical protein OPKNFCMD_4366 [Methylobacterium crusticola]|uniref:Glycosyltransferase n=1 Tax=Methylobacterium crusticola TaxID=1697972 RepID=A0ABQ4R2V8_9HYPH|nr:glycosyltransferase [Methylobacterium crusticola]GJD51611.1 hypothetical protein OPKNFCMD_4366 [Methylobacterium crusticola]